MSLTEQSSSKKCCTYTKWVVLIGKRNRLQAFASVDTSFVSTGTLSQKKKGKKSWEVCQPGEVAIF